MGRRGIKACSVIDFRVQCFANRQPWACVASCLRGAVRAYESDRSWTFRILMGKAHLHLHSQATSQVHVNTLRLPTGVHVLFQ
jgi:hypothetical protein